ncbi:alkaline phosphatase D family protein [Cryobacterium luteum]|uniref:Alkaline phosphatase family protein n=1 Tax=Cryobacterium luteum TaxID=1424661 RepID=A0A1H8J5N5_9MICO|nr:alkaline phosphatase D family protein [Cryobacterium luteum]TFB93327.1 alkaline phosphatase family protein [Cryobacterium luteum]SEN75989.1 PhoD-like phosphatase [Cryobacterium luteum]
MTSSRLILGPMMRYVDAVSASIWFETRDAGQVVVRAAGRSWAARTFAVHGHHYALVHVHDLHPDSTLPYTVEIDGNLVWPDSESAFPASVIATLGSEHALRLSFGSCRTSVPHDENGNRSHGVDALRASALRLASPNTGVPRPDLILFLGDQVYADLTTEKMQEFIRARRDISEPPGEELADFEEYAHLYRLAWSDEANRWLLATVPTAMIFDDHDIRDDWNTSLSWKREMEATTWWRGRIVAGLASYWVYQHLGNMSPAERADDEMWREIAGHSAAAELDISARLDAFAQRCDQEPTSYRWSYCRDINDVRLIVVDSRAARQLEPARRALLDEDETHWLDERMRGGFRHLLVGTSLPFLLPPGLHHLEAWDEAVSEGAWGKPAARMGERLRQLVDLEHWGAFQRSFRQLARMATEVADGQRGTPPQTVTFLSGDVHYSTVSEVQRTSGSRIVQAVCSPIRNPLPRAMRSFSAVLAYGIATRLSALLARSAGVSSPPFRWSGIKGPWFDNCLASLEDTPAGLELHWERGVVQGGDHGHPLVETVATITLTPRAP